MPVVIGKRSRPIRTVFLILSVLLFGVSPTDFYVDGEPVPVNRSPESTFVLSGLEKLEGHWSDSKVAEHARIARRSAADTYGTPDQPKTSSSAEGSSGTLESAKQRHTGDIFEANAKLKRIAGRLSEG